MEVTLASICRAINTQFNIIIWTDVIDKLETPIDKNYMVIFQKKRGKYNQFLGQKHLHIWLVVLSLPGTRKEDFQWKHQTSVQDDLHVRSVLTFMQDSPYN